jgi:hypothetical protein
VTTGEFDDAVAEIAAGRPLGEVAGLAFRAEGGGLCRTPPRPPI